MGKFFREVQFGRQVIGGNRPVVIQSMLSSPLDRLEDCLEEIRSLLDGGCDTIRVALAERRSLDQFLVLKKSLPDPINWIADVHFLPRIALDALPYFHKVRINPGNFGVRRKPEGVSAAEFYGRELETVTALATQFFARARDCGTAVRIGVNEGSLSKRMLSQCGDRTEAMVRSAMEMTTFAEAVNFRQLVYSFKSSDVAKTIAVNRLAQSRLAAAGWNFPFHLGVTESGFGVDGKVKSAIGIGTLLSEGIGHTIRVSLSEAVKNEVQFAKDLLRFLEKQSISLEKLKQSTEKFERVPDPHSPLAQRLSKQMLSENGSIFEILAWLSSRPSGEILAVPTEVSLARDIVDRILQICGHGNFQAEIVSCPTCSRTRYNVEEIARQVKARFSRFTNLRIAIMGCIVNGLGEMGDADYAYVGTGNGRVNLYRNGICCHRNIDEKDAINFLEKIVENDHHTK